MDQNFWNTRYGEYASVYGEGPNQYFKEQLDALKPARILLPAEGEGRNAIYAASKGWQVDAFDFSEVAKQKADAAAQARGLSIHYWLDDLDKVPLPPDTYDVIALIYVHMNSGLRQRFIPRCITAIKPGGHLLMEVYAKEQLQFQSGGPKDPDMLYDTTTLATELGAMNVKVLQKMELVLEEGDFHKGLSSVIRVVAIKK